MNASNILLITIDSLRADHLSAIGYNRPTSPRIDELAAEGATFTQAIANGPNTPTSFPSILTSTYPQMYGGYRYLHDEYRPFVAKTLGQAGFETVGYHSNPHLGSEQNYDSGFDTFNDSAEGSDSVASLKDRVEEHLDPDSKLYSVLRRVWHYFTMTTDTSAYAKADTISNNAIDWLKGSWDGDDLFMWLHYMDVHYPFTPPDRFQTEVGTTPLSTRRVADLNGKMQENPDALTDSDVQDLLALYDAEIRFADYHIGRVLDELAVRGALDETLVVVTADHGEAFGEHDRFGHHPYLYDELLHVPLVFAGPGIPDQRIDQQVSLIDIGPTVYDRIGVETPAAVQGQSLEPLLDGEEMDERVALCTAMDGYNLACRTNRWKCFWQRKTDEIELYNLQNDAAETVNVAEDHPEVVKQFRERMESHIQKAEASDVDQPEVEQSEAVEQRLKDLGYVD